MWCQKSSTFFLKLKIFISNYQHLSNFEPFESHQIYPQLSLVVWKELFFSLCFCRRGLAACLVLGLLGLVSISLRLMRTETREAVELHVSPIYKQVRTVDPLVMFSPGTCSLSTQDSKFSLLRKKSFILYDFSISWAMWCLTLQSVRWEFFRPKAAHQYWAFMCTLLN